MAKKRKFRQQTRAFRKAKKRKLEPRIKAYHNTFQSNVEAIQKDGYIRSNAELKSLGVHQPNRRTGDLSVPMTDEQAIFLYPHFAQYSSQRVTYGVNNETHKENFTEFRVKMWDNIPIHCGGGDDLSLESATAPIHLGITM